MRRIRIALFTVAVASMMAVVLASAASAGKATHSITSITTQSYGVLGSYCYFTGSVEFTGYSHRGDTASLALYRVVVGGSDTWMAESSGPIGNRKLWAGLGTNDLTTNLTPANYYFQVSLKSAKGVTFDTKDTSTFYMSGCPAEGATLGTYTSS